METIVNESYSNTEIDEMLTEKVNVEKGKGLSSNDFTDTDVLLLKKASQSILVYGDVNEFPNIGDTSKLYIDNKSGVSYIWDDTSKSYKNIGKNNIDYDQIQSAVDASDTND